MFNTSSLNIWTIFYFNRSPCFFVNGGHLRRHLLFGLLLCVLFSFPCPCPPPTITTYFPSPPLTSPPDNQMLLLLTSPCLCTFCFSQSLISSLSPPIFPPPSIYLPPGDCLESSYLMPSLKYPPQNHLIPFWINSRFSPYSSSSSSVTTISFLLKFFLYTWYPQNGYVFKGY